MKNYLILLMFLTLNVMIFYNLFTNKKVDSTPVESLNQNKNNEYRNNSKHSNSKHNLQVVLSGNNEHCVLNMNNVKGVKHINLDLNGFDSIHVGQKNESVEQESISNHHQKPVEQEKNISIGGKNTPIERENISISEKNMSVEQKNISISEKNASVEQENELIAQENLLKRSVKKKVILKKKD